MGGVGGLGGSRGSRGELGGVGGSRGIDACNLEMTPHKIPVSHDAVAYLKRNLKLSENFYPILIRS